MFRRRLADRPDVPEWERRIAEARSIIEAQRPPTWIIARLDAFHRAVTHAVEDRARVRASLGRLDADRAAAELKEALRNQRPGPEHERLVASLRQRYESINRLHDRDEALGLAIDRALVDVDVLAVRSIELGGRDEAWRVDDAVRHLADDLKALELAHDELSDL